MELYVRKEYILRKTILASIVVSVLAIPWTFLNAIASSEQAGVDSYISFEVSNLMEGIAQEEETAVVDIVEEATPVVKPKPEKIKGKSLAKSNNMVYWKTVRAKVTAYSPDRISCGRFADGRTSIGKNAWNMVGVATYSAAIPYGAVVDIPGVGKRVVDDTGSGMRRSWRRGVYHIDLRMTYPYQCRRWGVRWMNVKLYKPKRS